MKKVFLVYGHYNEKSFNSAIKNTFIKSAEENKSYLLTTTPNQPEILTEEEIKGLKI